MGILIKAFSETWSRVEIILVGSVAVDELAKLLQAFCVVFGLINASHLNYPECMKNSFHFVQQVMFNSGTGRLISSKIQPEKSACRVGISF